MINMEIDELEKELNKTCFHGLLPRADIEPLLRENGSFVVRKTQRNGEIILALSVKWDRRIKHFVFNQDESGMYYFESHKDKTIHGLIDWHMKNGEPVSTLSGVKLIKGIGRQPWLLNHDEIVLQKKLGEGAFGEVHLALYITPSGKRNVAVKTMREEATRHARLQFMKEARIMRKFAHPNVIRILGVAVYENPLMIVMELCPGGSVLAYVRKMAPVPNETKLRFCCEAAAGLAYLEAKNCIHRDIAARNCLLSAKYDVKISDFGMSDERRFIHDDKLRKVPMKWLAPETMQQRVFSSKSDVWAYGVMVYEIYADGGEPYPGLSNLQARAKIVVQNYRMEMPKITPQDVDKLVHKCWETDPNARPSFSEIYEILCKLQKQ
uniref:Tyrosine-protein kinase n=1 Tax=Parascaris univalens TaxID=6257 RepID=A0A915AJQ2_PARUN